MTYYTVCLVCGSISSTWSGRGRMPRYCSAKCRMRAMRAREAGKCSSPALCGQYGHVNGCPEHLALDYGDDFPAAS